MSHFHDYDANVQYHYAFREGTASQEEIEEFIDDTVWRTLLSSNLDATKKIRPGSIQDPSSWTSKQLVFELAAAIIKKKAGRTSGRYYQEKNGTN